MNVEADEAGKLKRFREKFGRGWDASAPVGGKKKSEEAEEEEGGERTGEVGGVGEVREEEDNLMDLISGFGRKAEEKGEVKGGKGEKAKVGKGKGGDK